MRSFSFFIGIFWGILGMFFLKEIIGFNWALSIIGGFLAGSAATITSILQINQIYKKHQNRLRLIPHLTKRKVIEMPGER